MVQTDGTHPFNRTDLVARPGYFSSADPALDLTADATWTAANGSVLVGTDASGNTVSYLIQRMCRTAEQLPRTDNCLFSAAATNNNGMSVPLPSDICNGPGCPQGGQSPLYRVTVRVDGAKNTVSYIQSIVH